MLKPLAIFGAVAGALCAVLLTSGRPLFGGLFAFGNCSVRAETDFISRDLSWSGDDAIEISVPASVHFKVGPQWRAVAKGPAGLVDHLRIRNGRIEFDRSRINFCDTALSIELAGPSVRQWMLVGSGDLNLDNMRQADIDLGIRGSGSATVSGNAERIRISIAGSGDARFGQLIVKDAIVQINGSGGVDIAPEDAIAVEINGSGHVQLLKSPKSVHTRIHGSGNVIDAT